MKIGIAAGLAILAVAVAAPLARHHLGFAEAQTRPAHSLDPAKVEPIVIGMNTGALSFYNSEEPFADPIMNHGVLYWESDPRGPYDNQVPHDDGGHPINAPIGAKFSSTLHQGRAPIIPGTYHCQTSPGWLIQGYLNDTVFQSGTKFTVDVPKLEPVNPVAINITADKNGASLLKLSCRYPGDKSDALFRKEYLEDMRPFRVIRYMDWMVTNGSPLRTWAKRPTPNSMDQINNGVAVEYMVALSNQLQSDPWFTLPLHTDKDYYRNFATYVRDHLDPNLKAYVELSNETWNDGFQQAKDTTAEGKKRYPGVSDDKANDYFYGDRVRELMDIWSDVYKGQEKRIVRVLGSQLWELRGEQRLSHGETWKHVDALAIAPYWGDVPFDVPGEGKARIEEVIRRSPGYIDKVLAAGKANKVMAAKYGIPVITYEGGPGFFAYEPKMGADMDAVSHDPRIYSLYQSFLTRWQKEIGGLLVLFEGTGSGLFAHKDWTGQPLSGTPKMRSVVDFINKLPPDQQPRPLKTPAP